MDYQNYDINKNFCLFFERPFLPYNLKFSTVLVCFTHCKSRQMGAYQVFLTLEGV
jgi:hypothetical protein